MKRLFGLAALFAVATTQAAELDTQLDTLKSVELQNVQVVATRATHKTPVAFTNMSKEQHTRYPQDACRLHEHVERTAEGCQLRTGHSLSAVADTQHYNDQRCW